MSYSGVALAAASSATLPFAGLYAPAGNGVTLREIKVFTTAANAARILIQRATTAGTWSAVTEVEHNEDSPAVTGVMVHTASSTPPTMGSPFDVGAVGAAIGSGFHYTYYGEGHGLYIPPGTGNGIVVIEVADTANTYDVMFLWDE